MSPPFYIRNLHEDRGDSLSLDLSEYEDLIVQKHPNARLMYLDEDDGEMITVGSGLELSQRLEEPAPPLSRYAYKDKDLEDNPMHMFDIHPTDEVRTIWMQTKSDSLKRHSSQALGKTITTLSLLEGNARRYLSRDPPHSSASHESDARKSWSQVHQLPRLSQSSSTPVSDKLPASITQPETWKSKPCSTSRSSGSTLTPEGERKTKEVGEKPGWQVKPESIRPVISTEEDIWASNRTYLESASPFTFKAQKPEDSRDHHMEDAKQKVMFRSSGAFLSPITQPSNSISVNPEIKGKSREDRDRPSTGVERGVTAETPKLENSTDPSTEPTIQDAGETVVKAVHALATGMGLLGAALSKRLPELEDTIANVQQSVPEHVGDVVSQGVEGLQSHAEALARTLHQAADASRSSAERIRQADAPPVEEFLTGLGDIIADLGKAWFTPVDNKVNQDDASKLHEPASVVAPLKQDEVNAFTASEQMGQPPRLGKPAEHSTANTSHSTKQKEQEAGPRNPRPSVTFAERPAPGTGLAKPINLRRPLSMAYLSSSHVDGSDQTIPARSSRFVPAPKSVPMPKQTDLAKSLADRYRLRRMQSTPTLNRNSEPILDLEDADFEFSARYPSLLTSNNLHRNNTVANPMSHSGYLRNMNPEVEIARFPTVSELEHRSAHNDYSYRGKHGSEKVSKSNTASKTSMNDSEFLQRLPGAWPQTSSDAKLPTNDVLETTTRDESSGEFFERMTGRRASTLDDTAIEGNHDESRIPRRAHTTAGNTRIEADIHPLSRQRGINNFSIGIDTEAQRPLGRNVNHPRHRPQQDRSDATLQQRKKDLTARLKHERQAATAQSSMPETLWSQSNFSVPNLTASSTSFHGSRRPYSTHYTGTGRSGPINTLLQSSPPPPPQPRRSQLVRPKSMHINLASPTTAAAVPSAPSKPALSRSSTHPHHHQQPLNPQTTSAPPPTSTQAPSKIDACTRHLRNLGYASTSAFSDDRLRMIATMAGGDVAEAIDVIEEERKAWERRGW